jgi:hypothetical protein
LLKKKSDAFKKYQDVDRQLETQEGIQVKILQTDRGGEYLGEAFTDYLG